MTDSEVKRNEGELPKEVVTTAANHNGGGETDRVAKVAALARQGWPGLRGHDFVPIDTRRREE